MTKLFSKRKRRNQGDSELSLEDTLSLKQRGVPVRSKTGVAGYNPYDAEPTAKPHDPANTPTDLRKLSEWIRLQRQLEALKTAKTKPE